MITISRIVSWSDADEGATRRDIRELCVAVSDRARSAEFYARVFGFRRRAASNAMAPSECVLGNGAASLYLRRPHCASLPAWLRAGRWAFVVRDLQIARERVWELGLRIARDSGEPDHVYRRAYADSLYVYDLDGNEIELVELHGAPAAAQVGGERVRAVCAARWF